VRRFALKAHEFLDNECRPTLDFGINAADVLTENPHAQQLHATQEKNS